VEEVGSTWKYFYNSCHNLFKLTMRFVTVILFLLSRPNLNFTCCFGRQSVCSIVVLQISQASFKINGNVTKNYIPMLTSANDVFFQNFILHNVCDCQKLMDLFLQGVTLICSPFPLFPFPHSIL